MARRTTTLDVDAILEGLGGAGERDTDETTAALLDAASNLLSTYGMRRWSMDDVAEMAGLGRATVYRHFEGRDELVHAAIARDARRFFMAVSEAVADAPTIEDKLVEGFLVGLRAVKASLVPALIASDAATALSVLMSSPVLDLARAALVERYLTITREKLSTERRAEVELVAEAVVRLAMSFTLIPGSVIDLDDDLAARDALRRLLIPLIRNEPRPSVPQRRAPRST